MAVVAALLVALPLLGWAARGMVTDTGDTDASGTPSPTPLATTTPEDAEETADEQPGEDETDADETADADARADDADGDDEEIRRAINACAGHLVAGKAVVTEAATGVGHWDEHIQARTDLLEGRNTQEETREIWRRTRLAGPDDQERFATATSTYESLDGCDGLAALAEETEELPDQVQVCLDEAEMVEHAVAAAAEAMGDWQHHLHDMAEHADGGMTADEAQEKWVEAWTAAPTNINAFNDARDELDDATDCTEDDS